MDEDGFHRRGHPNKPTPPPRPSVEAPQLPPSGIMEELSDGKQVHVHIHQAAPTQTQAPSRPHRPPTRVHARPWWVSGSGFGWISLYTLLLAGLGLGIYILIKEGLL